MGIDWDSLREAEFPVTGAGPTSTTPPRPPAPALGDALRAWADRARE